MPAGSTTTYRSARILAPDLLVREAPNVLTCPVYQSGALVAPTSGTVTVYRPDGTAIIDAQSVTITGSIATYTISAATLPSTESLGLLWMVVWALNFASAPTVETYRNDAALIRYALYPTLTDADLYRVVSSLDPSGSTPITTETTWQDKRDLAWGEMIGTIIESGERPDLITTPSALHRAQRELTLALIFDDLSSRLNPAYATMADKYRRQYKDALKSLSYGVDSDNDGRQDSTSRRSLSGTLWLGGHAGL